MQSHFSMFARYNDWANRRLYESASALSDPEYRADRGAFFGSVHGTLNHLLVTDRIWMNRFTGAGPTYSRLDEIPFEDFRALRAAREAEDRRIIEWIDGLRRGCARRELHLPHHRQSERDHAAAGAGAGAFLQSPDASSRPGACAC